METLGGRLVAPFLCACNSKVGTREDSFRHDPSIRLAVQRLRREIPQLAESLEEGQAYFADSSRGRIRLTRKRGRLRVDGFRESERSFFIPTEGAPKAIRNLLEKHRVGIDIEDAIARFGSAIDDVDEIHLGGPFFAKKWSHTPPRPALGSVRVHDSLLLKIAYEFMACHLGSSIFDPKLTQFRAAILQGTPGGGNYIVERSVLAGTERSIHGIALESSGPPLVVQVRLFGSLAFRVQFIGVAYRGPRMVYTLDLTTGKEHLAEIAETQQPQERRQALWPR
jgi:hypothetical protein